MDERTYLTILYDYYGDLLTDKQQKYFEEYYFNNLSLGEISENLNISRNAVHKQIKALEKILNNYENKLKLYEKGKKLENVISSINNDALKVRLEELK